ncbi:hypothetical protein [Brevundimonas sp.]|uniref:hypothetical protein n=1 Tax=Brevundimonas sp. TaxID=1871086 RepID=UPI00289AE336|nr:hypothetical protein [Brevundimonas sp.]
MAKLPQALDMAAPNARLGGGAVLDFSSLDNALQGAARQVERVDESRRRADDEVAGRVIEEVRQSYMPAASERAYGYDGRAPGFAETELKAFDDHFAILDQAEMSDGVRLSVGRQLRDLRTRTAAQAIANEAETRGRRSAADRDAAEQADAVRALMGVQQAFDTAEDERRQTWDGLTPIADITRTSWREFGEKALADLPAPVADRLRPMLLSQEASLFARSMAAEDQSRDARTLTTVGEGLNGFVNRATRDPSLMSRFDAEIQPILDAAPAALRPKLKEETWQAAQAAALNARIERGEFDAVDAELKAGRYDRLDARSVERLRSGVESAKQQGVVVDAMRSANLEAGIAADLRDILSGKPANAALIAEARLIGGEPLATKVRLDQQAALNVRPLIGRLRTMTPQQADAELERMTAAAGTAEGARTLELAREMIQQDRGARADPAAWSATSFGPGDAIAAEVQRRLRAYGDDPTPTTARGYALAQMEAQRRGGVPEASRRVLSRSQAEAWISAVDADGQPQASLQSLAARIEMFGADFRPRLMRELTLAGLKPADLGALSFYAASPARMQAYAAARGQKLNDLVPEKTEREQIDRELGRQLQSFTTILATPEGAAAALEAAKLTAYAAVKRGDSVRDAVRSATAPMNDGWAYQETWAIPASAQLNAGRARLAAGRRVEALLRRNGEGLWAPPSTVQTPAQSRRVYADTVRNRAEWRNLEDRSGIELVTPSANGAAWLRVKDAAGRDVVMRWSDLDRDGTVVSGARR